MKKIHPILRLSWELTLLVLLVIGLAARFSWVNWHQGANLHPDEYGLTNTLTQLRLPQTLAEYFDTRRSPISPYNKYDLAGVKTADGPDNRMRWGQWPIILIRAAAEASGQTGYDEIRLLGRRLSALCDTLSVLLILLIGWRLHGRAVGLLAAALSSLAVMQIQQSHFMTVDNFGGFFTSLALYACVRIAQQPCARRRPSSKGGDGSAPVEGTPLPASASSARAPGDYHLDPQCWRWGLVFGVAFGMAVACKINLLPLGGMLLVALFLSIADLKLKSQRDLYRLFGIAALLGLVTFGVALLTFRLTHPMAFRAPQGETTLWTLSPNTDWIESMALAQMESSGIGGGPPGEQWTARLPIIFPLINQVVWGMGLPLGLAAWAAYSWAAWRSLRHGAWRVHLIGLVWVGGYFGYMGTRWVKSIRYFLPTYPFLCLFAAWGLTQLWQHFRKEARRPWAWAFPGLLMLIVVGGTFTWAEAFMTAVYRTDHTRIQATRWIFEHVPGPFHLTIEAANGVQYQPIPAPDQLTLTATTPYEAQFVARESGFITSLTIPHARANEEIARLHIAVAAAGQSQAIGEAWASVTPAEEGRGAPLEVSLERVAIREGQHYRLEVSLVEGQSVSLYRSVVANENWDEGLPFPFDGWDPFGQLYTGTEMEVRWADDENKRQMYLDRLARVDYIILPSQRGIWSTCRLPRTYPMTIAYYRALFDGRLGFELVARFTSPWRLGPLVISDVGGTAAWGQEPPLPLFNNNLLAAEEAFSVYDHPPVWVFKKRADFSLQNAAQILQAIDLEQVVYQSPREADGPPCK